MNPPASRAAEPPDPLHRPARSEMAPEHRPPRCRRTLPGPWAGRCVCPVMDYCHFPPSSPATPARLDPPGGSLEHAVRLPVWPEPRTGTGTA